MATEVKFLSQIGPAWVDTVSAVGYVRKELVTGRTLVDGQRDREMIYHRFSFSETVSGDFEPIYEMPFGLAGVSG